MKTLAPNPLTSTNPRLAVNTIKVLLVGNNPRGLAESSVSLTAFRAKNFQVETAFSNQECYKKILKYKPAAIILDDSIGYVEMLEITEKLHLEPKYARIPVIMIKNSSYHPGILKQSVEEIVMKDHVLAGGLPDAIIRALSSNPEVYETSARAENESIPFDKKISKLLATLFSSSGDAA